MSGDMVRNPGATIVPVGNSEINASAFPFQDFAGGFIHVPSTETSQTLTFFVADSDGESPTYSQAYDTLGNAIALVTTAGNSYEINPALFGALSIKIVASAVSAGSAINYKLTMKS